MSKRIIAIGDIHGCSIALATPMEVIDPQAKDTIVTLGDYSTQISGGRWQASRLLPD